MPQASDALLSDLGLQRADHAVHEWSDEPGSKIFRAGLTHPGLHRMLAKAEEWAPMLLLNREVVFSVLRDLVIEESERSPFGLVAIEEGAESEREPTTLDSMSLGEILTEAARLADARNGPPRAPEWAVPLDD